MKMTPLFYELACQMLITSNTLQSQHPNIDSDLMEKLIDVENELVKPLGLPAHAQEVNDMLQEFQLFGDDSKTTVQQLYDQLTNFAIWKLSTNAKTDLQLLEEAQEHQLMFNQVMPYIGFYATVFNNFLYKHCLMHIKLPPQLVLDYFNELQNEESLLFKANRAIDDYENWMQWQELLRINKFEYHKEFGQYCQYQQYDIQDIKRELEANTKLYHIRKIYFDEELLEANLLRVDIGCKDKEQWVRTTITVNKDYLLKSTKQPINMQFQEVLQGRIIRFFDDDEEDIDIVLPVDLVADYGRGLIINKSIFE
jgi:hypothetical protein